MSATGKDTTASSTPSFIAALVTGAIVVGVLTAVWVIFHGRQAMKKVFQPRLVLSPESKRPPPLPAGIVPFWRTVFKVPSEQIMVENGLDAYLFHRFITIFGVYMLVPYVLLTCSVCIGVSAAKPNQGQSGLNYLTFGNVATDQQNRHIAHFLVALILIGWTLYLLWQEFNHYVNMRQKWLTSPQHLALARSRTVAVTNVPDAINSETGLKELAGNISTLTGQSNNSAPRISDATAVGGVPPSSKAINGINASTGGVRNVWLSRQVKEAEKVWTDRDKECARLESGVAKLVKVANKNYRKGKTPEKQGAYDSEKSSHMVDRFVAVKKQPTWKQGLLGLIGKKQTLESSPVYIKEHNEELAALRAKEYPLGNTAFIRFSSQAEAHAFARLAPSTKGNKLMKASIEVVPEDVQWSNISMNPHMRRIRTIISWALTIGLMIVWAPIIAFVGLVSNVDALCQKASWLAWLCKIPSAALGIIKGVLPPVLLAVVFMLLPVILRLLVRLQGETLKSEIELKVFSRYWLFQIIHGFLIVTLASGLGSALSNLAGTASQVPNLLATKLPNASIFFLTWVLTTTFSGAAQSYSRVKPIIMYSLRGILGGKTPRKFYNSEWTIGGFGWATAWPPLCLLVTITMVYSVIQPIITLLSWLAMLVLYAAWKYTLTWAADQPDYLETGGQFYRRALRTVFVGLYVESIMLAALFFLSTDQTGKRSKAGLGCGVIMIIAIITIALFQIYIDWKAFTIPYTLYVHAPTTRKAEADGATAAVAPEVEDEFDNAGPELGNTSGFHEHAFDHPALWKKQPCIWIWDDTLGVGKFEAERINNVGVEASTEYAHMDAEGKLSVDRSAPDEAWFGGHSS